MTPQAREAEQKQKWDREFDQGRWDFLHKPEEQTRLKKVAAMIDDVADEVGHQLVVVDMGSGEGMLGHWLTTSNIASYVAVDISRVALARIPDMPFPVHTFTSSIERFAEQFPDLAPQLAVGPETTLVFVANEVLYYDLDSVDHLARMILKLNERGFETSRVIVSAVGPHPDKPNWTRSSRNLWARIRGKDWQLQDHEKVASTNSFVHWNIALYAT